MLWFSKVVFMPPLEIETLSLKGLALSSSLHSASFKTLRNSNTNPFVKNTIVIWHVVQ